MCGYKKYMHSFLIHLKLEHSNEQNPKIFVKISA